MSKIKNSATAHAGKNVEQGEHSSIAGGSANLYNHSGNQFGGFSENCDWLVLPQSFPTLEVCKTNMLLPSILYCSLTVGSPWSSCCWDIPIMKGFYDWDLRFAYSPGTLGSLFHGQLIYM